MQTARTDENIGGIRFDEGRWGLDGMLSFENGIFEVLEIRIMVKILFRLGDFVLNKILCSLTEGAFAL